MKYADMNARQKKAFRNIANAANWIIGGLENTMLDNEPESEEYKNAYARLHDHDALVAEIYDSAITDIYDDGFMCWGAEVEKYLKDIRFCGREWLMERVEKRVLKLGY